MSADLLREAAALMRVRAEAASPGPWRQESSEMCANVIEADDDEQAVASTWAPSSLPDEDYRREEHNAEHIASWHPAVALAVANLLDESARSTEAFGTIGQPGSLNHCCFAVACAYLGRTP